MMVSVVLTIIGPDRPGVVESISNVISRHDANWLESRMSRLAGQFAGILHVAVPDAQVESLKSGLVGLSSEGLEVVIQQSLDEAASGDARTHTLALVGTDHPGIIRDISSALAARSVNVIELSTGCVSAPMSGEKIFKARAKLQVPENVGLEELRRSLEKLASDLMVDITLDTARTTDGS